MGLAGLLIVLGIIIWLLVNPVIGLVLLLCGLAFLVFSAVPMGGRSRRVWY